MLPSDNSFKDQKAVLGIEVNSLTPQRDVDLKKGERGGDFFMRGLKKVAQKVDLYAIKEVPHTLFASAVSLLILVGTLVYTIIMVYQYVHQGLSRTAEVHWTPSAGPFPAELQCLAENGCFVSNRVDTAWTYGVAVIPSQMSCFRVPFGESVIINMTYSTNPVDGLDVIYNGSATPADCPPLFGLFLTSLATCGFGQPMCNEGAMPMSPPIGPGIDILDVVETTNHSQSGAGSFRREWFVSRVDKDNSVTEGVCLEAYPELSDPVYVQSSLRLAASYTEQDILYESLFLVIMGSVGGAYSLFLQAGALLLVLSIIYDMYAKSKASRQANMEEAEKKVPYPFVSQKTRQVLQYLKINRIASGTQVYPSNLGSHSSSELEMSPAAPAFLGQPPDLSQGFLDELSGASATSIMGQAFSMVIDLQALLAAGDTAPRGLSSAAELEFPRSEEKETAIKLLGSLCTPAYELELLTDTVHMIIFLGMLNSDGNNRISWKSKFPARLSSSHTSTLNNAVMTAATRFGGILQAMYAIENLALQIQRPVRKAHATLAW
eukprot:gene13344-19185_t